MRKGWVSLVAGFKNFIIAKLLNLGPARAADLPKESIAESKALLQEIESASSGIVSCGIRGAENDGS